MKVGKKVTLFESRYILGRILSPFIFLYFWVNSLNLIVGLWVQLDGLALIFCLMRTFYLDLYTLELEKIFLAYFLMLTTIFFRIAFHHLSDPSTSF